MYSLSTGEIASCHAKEVWLIEYDTPKSGTVTLSQVFWTRAAADKFMEQQGHYYYKPPRIVRFVPEQELESVKTVLARMKARPVEAEYARLDAMWQQLVRERDEAVHALSELRPPRGLIDVA